MALGPDASESWQCETGDGRFWIQAGVRESPDRLEELSLEELSLEYLDSTASGTGEEQLNLTVFLNGSPYGWVAGWLDEPTGTIDDVSLDGSTLTATGTAFLNEPLDQGITLLSRIPPDDLQPFTLVVSCNG